MARIRYLAFVSDDPAALAGFYQSNFGMNELGRTPRRSASTTLRPVQRFRSMVPSAAHSFPPPPRGGGAHTRPRCQRANPSGLAPTAHGCSPSLSFSV